MNVHIATGVASFDSYGHPFDALGQSLHGRLANAEEGVAVSRIAAEALGTVAQILQRMRTVVGQAGARDARFVAEISAAEITTLNSLLDYIAGQTVYRSAGLLDGSYQVGFQLGGGEVIGLDLRAADVGAPALGTRALDILATEGGPYHPTADLNLLDAAITSVSTAQATVGIVRTRLEETMPNLQTAITNVSASRSHLTDADLAGEVTVITRSHLTLLR